MRKAALCVLLSGAVILGGCANAGASYRPIIDYRASTNGGANYNADVADCQQYAQQVDTAGQAMAGAVVGVTGAISGAAGGAGQGIQSQQDTARRCMAGRSYSVLQ